MAALVLTTLIFGVSSLDSSNYTSGSMDGFFTLDDIKTWASEAADNLTYVSTGSIGTSAGGAEIIYVKVSSKVNSYNKSDILVTAETSTNPIHVNSVLFQYSELTDFAYLESDLATRNYWFIPVINVDSYSQMQKSYYSSNSTAFTYYQKNQISTNCSNGADNGININMNFPFHWNLTTANGCADNYAGSTSMSTQETSALINFVSRLNLVSWMHFDGTSPYYFTPYSYSSSSVYNSTDLSNFYQSEITDLVPTGFKIGTISKLIGATSSGALIDYAASIGALSLQFGSSSGSFSKNEIGTEVQKHLDMFGYISDVSAFMLEFEGQSNVTIADCSADVRCLNNNSDSSIQIALRLNNYGFAESPPMNLNVVFLLNNTLGLVFNVTQITRDVTYYNSAYNQTGSTGAYLPLSSANSTQYVIGKVGFLGNIPARSFSSINVFLETQLANKSEPPPGFDLEYQFGVVPSDGSTLMNPYLPELGGMILSHIENPPPKGNNGGLSATSKVLIGVFVSFGSIVLLALGVLIYCKYFRKPNIDKSLNSSYGSSALQQDAKYGTMDPKDVSLDLTVQHHQI